MSTVNNFINNLIELGYNSSDSPYNSYSNLMVVWKDGDFTPFNFEIKANGASLSIPYKYNLETGTSSPIEDNNPSLIEVDRDSNSNVITLNMNPLLETISCDGATNIAWFTDGGGTWDIEVNGIFYESQAGWGLGYLVSNTPGLSDLIDVSGDGDCIITSKVADKPLRIKLIRRSIDRWEIHEANDNPTIIISEEGDINFCLSPSTLNQISCDGATTETGVFELSGTFDIELNGQVVATNLEPQALVDYLNGTGDLEVEVIPESIVADYDSFYQTMTVTGRVGLAVETKDSNNIILGSGIIGSDGTVTYALNITDQVSNTPIYTKSELSNTVSHSLVIPIDTSWDIEYVVDGVATRVKAANQYGDIPDNYIDQNAVIGSATSLTINRTVRSVGAYGFRGCTMLTSLVLPTSLEIIYTSSFQNLTSLVSLVIPEGVTDLYPDAFAGCSSLKTIIVPSTMLNMHSGCFDNCFVCESITLHAVTPPTLSYPIFANNENIAIYVPAESVDVYKSAIYWSGYSSRIFAIP